jgi:hypothetical protein
MTRNVSRSSRGKPRQESAAPVRAGPPGLGRITTMAVIGITGSTDGIGRATARLLLADGHRVLVHARSRERGEPVAKYWVATSLCRLAT